MNSHEKLDATATETLIRFLAQRFGVKMPRLNISNRQANHGTYSSRKNQINLSRNAEAWVVAHEFAHHLDKIVNGAMYRQRLYGTALTNHSIYRRPHTRDIWHGEGFYNNLRLVVEAVGWLDYPWAKEYKQLRRWAERDGLLHVGE